MSKVFSERRFQPHLQRVSILAVGAIALALGSCTTPTTSTSETESSEADVAATSDEPLQVVTTFLPITQFTNAVAGDRAEVTQLLPPNVGPHDYQATPGDAQAIASADVLVQNGLEMEFFLDDMIENAGNEELVIVDSSEGVATLANDEDHGHDHGAGEAHDHDHAEGEAHDHDHAEGEAHDHAEGEEAHDHAEGEAHDHAEREEAHDHAEGDAHDHGEAGHHHAHGEFDPHIWLDPKRAIAQVENIRDGLIAVDPEGEAEYTANAEDFIAELQALDTEIAEQLAPFEGQTFVVFHNFAAYFAESYGLQSEVLVGLPEENPSPDDVKRVVETVQAEGLKTILTEPQVGGSSFEAIANDLDISVSVFDPIETGGTDALQPDYYLTTMRQNAENLSASFEADQAWVSLGLPQPVAVVSQRVGLGF
ncbi:metal ABC transporter solute-binding protein, Zn/Mn family [Vacuolonema iberomarrocanum]|uniref:metal ABC transporter solute-binding protein, Zn/Mn family n=1 Tax=Vacuolonema iberomarrocanum TaxID=3454632 RepID=UPI0019DAE328|nr:zinc ABC transporter substrate-binding protein [filamentous cyanobacterium LEGE 07170]